MKIKNVERTKMRYMFNEQDQNFNIQTENTSYVISILRNKYLLHLYYGKKINEYGNIEENLPVREGRMWKCEDIEDPDCCTGSLPMVIFSA